MNWEQLLAWAKANKAIEYRKIDDDIVFYRQSQSPGFENYFAYMSVIGIGVDAYAFMPPAQWQFLGTIPERDKNIPVTA